MLLTLRPWPPARGLLALAGAVCAATCCADEPPIDARPDAADGSRTDGGAPDAPRDVGGAGDIGRPGDAEPDAPVSGGWTRVSGTWPDWCRVEQADAELVASTAFTIRPCTDRPGCRQLVPDWPAAMGDWPTRLSVYPGHGSHDGMRGHFILRRDMGSTDTETWVVDDAGRPEVGFRSDRALLSTCATGVAAVGAGRVTVDVAYGEGDSWFSAQLVELSLSAPYELRFAGDVAATTSALDDIQDLYVSADAVAAHLTSFHLLRVTEARGIEDAYFDTWALGTLSGLVGETLLFGTYDGARNDVRAAPPGGPPEVLSSPTRLASELTGDGEHLAWLEWDSNDRRLGAIDLDVMVSPYAESRAGLSPRSVEHFAVADLSPVGLGHGYAAFQVVQAGPDRMHLYRLTDGAIAEIVAPAGEWWKDQPAYLGPEEVAVPTRPDVGPAETRRLLFIRYDSLEWTVP